MSTCINRSHPEFIQLKEDSKDSENIVAAIVSLWQQKNPVGDRFPTLSEYTQYKEDIQGSEFPQLADPYFRFISSSLQKNWSNPEGDSVMGLLNRFKKSIGDYSKGSEVVLPEEALKHLLNTAEAGTVTPESLAEAVNGLNDYLNYSDLYLKSVLGGLESFLKNPDATAKQKVTGLFFAFELAGNYERQIDAIFPTSVENEFAKMADFFKHPNYKFLTEKVSKIRDSVVSIKNLHKTKLRNEVVEILYDKFKHNKEEIDELFDKEIRRLKEDLTLAKNDSAKRAIQFRINEEIRKKEEAAFTKRNLDKWLSDPKGAGLFSLFRSAAYMKDPAVQNIANYIYSILEDAKQEFFVSEVIELQEIMERIQKESGLKVDLRMDIRKIYAPYIRETVDENGNFALAIQTQMKEQELLNKYVSLKKGLETAETELEKDVLEEELETFMETYVERSYVPEVYQFRKMLPKELKKKMNILRAEITNILEGLDSLKIEEKELERLKEANKQLYNLQREYTDDGVLKQGEDLQNARIIKAYNRKAEELGINQFYITPASKRNFEIALQQQIAANKTVQDNESATAEAKEQAEKQLANWLSIYTRTVISPRFYEMRNEITAEIDDILLKYGDSDIGTLYRDLFSLLAGYRDSNGAYDGTRATEDLVSKSKELEEQIENLRQTDKKSLLSEDKQRLSILFNELKSLQVTSPTEYYLDEVENQKSFIRSKLLENQDWDENILEEQVDKLFEKSEWFLKNHIKVSRYRDNKKVEEWEPLSIWKFTIPSDLAIKKLNKQVRDEIAELEAQNDPSLAEQIEELKGFKVINRTSPSKIWYSYRVNPKFENPNYHPDLRFKVVKGAYYNDDWDKMNDEQRSIATDLLALYQRSQEKNYKSNRLRTLIPYVRKEKGELIYDTIMSTPGNLSDKLKERLRGGFFKNFKESMKRRWFGQDLQSEDPSDVYGEVNQFDVFGNPVSKTGKAIYMRYTKPMAKELMSFDMMKSIGLYMGEASKFRALREHQAEILAMQTVIEGSESSVDITRTQAYKNAYQLTGKKLKKLVKRELSEKESQEEARLERVQASQNVKGLINRLLYGENLKKYNNKSLDRVVSVGNWSLGQVSRMALAQNIQSTIKNLIAGMASNQINAGTYDITQKDLLKANVEGFKAAKDFLANPQVGNRPYRLRLLDYFGVIMGREFQEAKNIKSTVMRKHGNPFKAVHRFREATEYELQSTVAFAVLDKVYAEKSDGSKIKLTDAFEIRDNRFVPKEGVIINENVIKRVRAKIKQMNHHNQGIYDQIYQPEGTKYVLYRVAFYMGKWVMPKFDRLFREEVINYASATRSQGGYNAVYTFLRDTIKEKNNLVAAYRYARSPAEKKAMAMLMRQTAFIATGIILQRLIKHCDDDGRQDACDWLNWVLKGTADEVEALDPIGYYPNFIYGFVYQKTDKSAPEKFMYSLTSPVTRLWDAYGEIYSNVLDPFEPYYKYKSNGKVDWNVTDPTLAGQPAAVALTMKYYGITGLDVSFRRAEYKSRQESYFKPKWYVPQIKTRYVSRKGKVTRIKRRKKKEKK